MGYVIAALAIGSGLGFWFGYFIGRADKLLDELREPYTPSEDRLNRELQEVELEDEPSSYEEDLDDGIGWNDHLVRYRKV